MADLEEVALDGGGGAVEQNGSEASPAAASAHVVAQEEDEVALPVPETPDDDDSGAQPGIATVQEEEDGQPPGLPSKSPSASTADFQEVSLGAAHDQEPPAGATQARSQLRDERASQSQPQQEQDQEREQVNPSQDQHTPLPPSSATSSFPPIPPLGTRHSSSGAAMGNGAHPASPSASASTPASASGTGTGTGSTSFSSSMRRSSTTYSVASAGRASTSTTAAGRKPLLQGVLVMNAFETILNSKDARRIPPLKAAAQRALDILKEPLHAGEESEDRREDVFEALKLACETKTNGLMMTALDAIGKLVSYGFFNPPLDDPTTAPSREDGSARTSTDGQADEPAPSGLPSIATPADPASEAEDAFVRDLKSERLSETVIDTICDCFIETPTGPTAAAIQAATSSNPATADSVNLQIVKALLTLVLQDANGRGLTVHQSSLLKAVRTVYNIFLLSKSPTNQMVAQGALNQIVGSVFARVQAEPKLAARATRPSAPSPRPPNSRTTSEAQVASASAPAQRLSDVTPAQAEAAKDHEDGQPVDPLSDEATSGRKASRTSTETIRPAVVEQGATPGTEAESRKSGADRIEEAIPEVGDANLGADTASAAETSNGSAPPPPPQLADIEGSAEAKPIDQQASAEAPLPTPSGENGPKTPGSAQEGQQTFFSLNELHTKDAYLVFRALCKLGMKPLGVESERDMKSHAMRSKLLSLHLILSILHTHLPMFTDPNVVIYSTATKEFTPFVQAIKQYLLLCLSRNAVSPVLSVFELSCEIFWRILSGMRTRLKKEIEVLLNEIFLPILEMRNSSVRQKLALLNVFSRVCMDPQALVEIYINYDCDRTSLDNIYERLLNIISRISTTQYTTHTPAVAGPPGKEGKELDSSNAAATASWTAAMPFLPTIPNSVSTPSVSSLSITGQSTSSLSSSSSAPDLTINPLTPNIVNAKQTIETQLQRQSLECLISVIRSLVAWAGRPTVNPSSTSIANLASSSSTTLPDLGNDSPAGPSSRNSEDEGDRSMELPASAKENGALPPTPGSGTAESSDDPGRFETAKLRKTTLLEGIKKFNFKPKRGIAFLVETGFIRSREPKDIAAFLLHADGLSKAMIGEYLGEGDPVSVATMHAFVDFMEFQNMGFVDALRMFLQSFRLPGEAQKIDRYMLKFAERYIAGNPAVFANADTAYILSFSTIMLNTDAHSPNIKKGRMTKAEFFKNNRGINNGQDLPEQLLSDIYDEIHSNEIRMKDEVESAAGLQGAAGSGIATALSNVGRDFQREAYQLQSEGMANKTEALFRGMNRSQKRGGLQKGNDVFFAASHVEHVRPMFEVVWMPLLAGLSRPLQDSEEMIVVERTLEGFKQAIKIVCLFDLELERNAFVTTLTKFTFLNDFSEMKAKNVAAIRCLLDVAAIDGNYLKGSWKEVIICVSQLERFQLISRGVDSRAVPELGRKHSSSNASARTNAAAKLRPNRPTDEVSNEASSSHITNAADRIFSSSAALSGTAIVDFVRALSEVSWEEIQSSGLAEHPRVFCLQKLVEISYYNMGRIRLEWSQMWGILGEHFNQVCCHTNANVCFLALDSLRQLAMRFLEKQELANFNFQKDFLKPFEYAMLHNKNPEARDMILQCMQQMIQARVDNLRSGWRTMFGVFCAASKVNTERVANQAFDIVKHLNKNNFALIVTYGSFADLAVCLTDFCKISKYQKISLHAIEMLRGLIVQMQRSPECPITEAGPPARTEHDNPADDPMTKFWFPVLFGFYDIIMNGEDLEVRKRALDYLFETLKTHGHAFPAEFWDSVCKEVLFPIFSVLRSQADVSRFSTHEDMSVWLSTTMIQALRDLVDLFAHYFDVLVRMLDQLLGLLVECICQENDTLARIGTSCLRQLIEKNVRKLTPPLWQKIVTTLVQLFQTTTAYQLFDENLRLPLDPDAPESPSESSSNLNGFVHPTPLADPSSQTSGAEASATSRPLGFTERRRIFRQIIVKCVLQLLLIETAHDLLQNEEVYLTIPPADLLRLMAELDNSYRFAKRFNADKELRMALWKVGFMKQLPNLLKQESSSAATLVNVLLRMYGDRRPDHIAKRQETIQAFLPLGIDILEGYISLDAETQARNISAWTPVVAEVLQGICSWDDDVLQSHVSVIYPLAVDLLARDVTPEIRESVRSVFHRIGLTLNLFQAEDEDEGEGERGSSAVAGGGESVGQIANGA